MFSLISRAFTIGLMAAAITTASRAQERGLALEVQNPSSTPLVRAPVSFGVPVPKTPVEIYDLETFSLVVRDSNRVPVPFQYKALARWHGDRNDLSKPLKWILITFLADCPAASTVTYYIDSGPRVDGQLEVAITPSQITISTSPQTSFVLDRSVFSLFKSVIADGQLAVAAPGGSLRMMGNGTGPIEPVVTETVVEESGSVRAVVRQKGILGALRFTCRWYFHSGRKDVTVDFKLENPGAYGVFFSTPAATAYFDSLYLSLPINGANRAVTSSGVVEVSQAPFRLDQNYVGGDPLRMVDNFAFVGTHGGNTVQTGVRHDGAIEVGGAAGGVTVTVDRFWQNFPKCFVVEGQNLKIGLWPETGNGPVYRGQYATPTSGGTPDPDSLNSYRFEGSRWKSHRMIFDFHQGLRTTAHVAAVADQVNRPAMGRPLPLWTKWTRALGMPVTEKREWNEVSLQRNERLIEMIGDDSAADDLPGLGRIGLKAFRNRGGTYGGGQFFGWENYGDLIWGDGYSALHYDWPFSMLLNWYRGGSYELYDIGRDMAWYRRDYGQNHSTNPNEHWRGAAFYEKGWWHGNYRWGEPSHTWIHGILLHYVMTGEEASREAALETAQYLVRIAMRNWDGLWGERQLGWTVENLVDAYGYLGDPMLKIEADAVIRRFAQLELEFGAQGFVLNPGSVSPSTPAYCSPWQHNIVFNAIAKYTVVTGDLSHRDLLARMKTWFKNECIVRGSGSPTAYRLPYVYYSWAPGWTDGPSTHLLWPMSESMSWSALIFNDMDDFKVALELFDAVTRFHQASAGAIVNYHEPSAWSPISVRMTTYPGSESKILGNLLRWNTALPAIYTWITGTY